MPDARTQVSHMRTKRSSKLRKSPSCFNTLETMEPGGQVATLHLYTAYARLSSQHDDGHGRRFDDTAGLGQPAASARAGERRPGGRARGAALTAEGRRLCN